VQVPNASAGGGAGLGLSISRRIVQAHGGQISVRSEPGQGTTFTFTVPVASEAPD
jgi:signal transduction histidine kinase